MSEVDAFESARRIEAIERDAWTDFYGAAPAELRSALGVEHRRIDDGVLLIARAIDNLQFNRLSNFGVVHPARGGPLDAAIAAFEAAGVKDWVVHVSEKDAVLAQLCAQRGLTPHPRTWAKFMRDGAPAQTRETALTIREVGASEAEVFGAAAAAGFGMPPVLAQWLTVLPGRTNWRCFVGFDGAKPVASGAAFLADGAAWLGIGATLPEYRGRGAQPALLAQRINAARDAGATIMTTETGIPYESEAAASFNNIQRAGFTIAYRRPNLRRAP